MRQLRDVGVVLVASWLSACGGATTIVSSWRAPTAEPIEAKGARVVAVVMMKDEAKRRDAEDTLAAEITDRGAAGYPMYRLLPGASRGDEAAARVALEREHIDAVIVMRPMSITQETVTQPVTYMGTSYMYGTPAMYAGPAYSGYWGGYYGYGWGQPYGGPGWGPGGGYGAGALPASTTETYTTTTITVTVETLLYSMKQNKLLWAGQSESTDPSSVDSIIGQLAKATAQELNDRGLIIH